LNIIVLVKPVPDPKAPVRLKPDGTIDREKVPLTVNLYDKHAVEAAVRIKEKYGGKVIAISMAPPHAIEVLREALAMGVDDAILLSDKRLAGSDTLATSYALSQAIRKIGDFDLILCGMESTDGNTGHVGPEVAEFLGIPHVTYVERIEIRDRHVIVKRLVEGGYEILKVKLPALLTITNTANEPRIPTIRDVLKARRKTIIVWNVDDIGVDPNKVGLRGSPTRILKIEKVILKRKGKIFTEPDVDKVIESFLAELKKDGVSLVR